MNSDNIRDDKRIQSIDLIRGLVMIVMALDHVRDFFHAESLTGNPLDLNTTTTPLFFTRWITHFCAPTFVFLSGVSAYLSGRNKSRSELSSFLIKRGLWLVIADAVLMTFILTFNPFYNFVFLTVLWAIGCSMILLGICLRLSASAILPVGLILVFGHNLFSLVNPDPTSNVSTLLRIFFTGNVVLPVDKTHIIGFLYAILPWTGIMFLGYAFGKYIPDRKRIMYLGLFIVLLFFILRVINQYGEPVAWQHQNTSSLTVLSFINTTKYPPSLQFLCMTIGPVLILLSLVRMRNSVIRRFVMTYGKVPFFYFVIHFVVAHLLLIIAFYITGHSNKEIVDPSSPFYFKPIDFGFSLPVVYLVWIIVVLALYYPCRWFYNYKKTHRAWWLRYL